MARKTTHTFEFKGKDNASKVIGKVTRSTQSLGDQVFKATSIISNSMNIIGGLSRAIGGVGRAVGATVQEFSKFEKGMSEVDTITDVSRETLHEYGMELRRLSTEYAIEAEDATKGLYQTISAGFGEDPMTVFAESARFATASLIDVEQAVDLVTTVLNSYQAGAESATEASDTLFSLIRAGKTTGEELATSLGRVTSVAYSAGVSFADLSTALAVMTQAGLKTDEATTSLRAVLQAVVAPTEKASKTIKELGLEFVNQETMSREGGLFLALNEIAQASEGSISKMQEVIPNVRALVGALAISGAENKLETMLNDITQSSGATETALEEVMNTFTFKWEQTKSAFSDFLISIGEIIATNETLQKGLLTVKDRLSELAEGLATGEGKFGDLKKQMDEFINNLLPNLEAKFDSLVDFLFKEDGLVRGLQLLNTALIKVAGAIEFIADPFKDMREEMRRMQMEQEKLIKDANTLSFEWISLEEPILTVTERFQGLTLEVPKTGFVFKELAGDLEEVTVEAEKVTETLNTLKGRGLQLPPLKIGGGDDGDDKPPLIPPEDFLLVEQNWERTVASMGASLSSQLSDVFQSQAVDPNANFAKDWDLFTDSIKSKMFTAMADPFIGAGSPMNTFFNHTLDMVSKFSQSMMDSIIDFFGTKERFRSVDQAQEIATNAKTQTTITGQNMASATASTSAWTPSAVMASIATLGSALAFGMLVSVVVRKVATMFAEGGMVDSPTLGMVGEDGAELIVPLTKPKRARELIGSASEKYPNLFNGDSKGSVNTFNINNNITINGSSGYSMADMKALMARVNKGFGNNLKSRWI